MATTTKQHFEQTASIIRDVSVKAQRELIDPSTTQSVLVHLASRFADAYACDNPRFDRHRFLIACGVTV